MKLPIPLYHWYLLVNWPAFNNQMSKPITKRDLEFWNTVPLHRIDFEIRCQHFLTTHLKVNEINFLELIFEKKSINSWPLSSKLHHCSALHEVTQSSIQVSKLKNWAEFCSNFTKKWPLFNHSTSILRAQIAKSSLLLGELLNWWWCDHLSTQLETRVLAGWILFNEFHKIMASF